MIHYFNSICEFRQVNPVIKGHSLKVSDPALGNIRDTLLDFKTQLENRYPSFRDIELSMKISKGFSNFPNVLYACILPPGQAVPNGIYTAICFDILGRCALAGCVESKITSKGLPTVKRTKSPKIDVDGASERTKYNSVFVNPKEFYYPLENSHELDQHITESLNLCFEYLKLS
ncbi:hypothetical protein MKJ01_09315 [Chryseobacterium sp. SSA4.19]|uniref:hypothetical protein n=1 Tax=Chryseobacterium sp. SSA4.19 TaxID=2919915 RepID=UPI001F4ECF87|nr:hypothetical protein [Chryseobacterium sp. SSA4.19]MCJ8153954.1 hypothetical protein [Chryseobacterium sp. SSA4.19]